MLKFRHVILDRDGVLNEEPPTGFVEGPDQWIWLPCVLDALSALAKAGILLSIATNQSCVGRGIIGASMLDQIHGRMKLEADRRGIQFSGVYFCPHAPDAGCICRKPMPGLLEKAIHASGISREQTVFIGDAASDLQAGQAAGIATWLVRTGKGMKTEDDLTKGNIKLLDSGKVLVFDDLCAVSASILSNGLEQKFS